MVYDEGEHFRFEYQVKDTISGMLKSSMKQLRVPVTQIVDVQLVRGWFNSAGVKIVLQASHMDTFKDIPGMNHGKVELQVDKANVPLAEAFVEGLHR
jgi:hypothetical protein